MNRKTLIVLMVALVVAVGSGVALGARGRPSPASPASGTPVAAGVVPVDVIAGSPDRFLGRRIVSGSVSSVDVSQHGLVLGCADACVSLPVKYDGPLPKVGANVTVTGTISKKSSGQYEFVASNVEVK